MKAPKKLKEKRLKCQKDHFPTICSCGLLCTLHIKRTQQSHSKRNATSQEVVGNRVETQDDNIWSIAGECA